MSSSITFCIQHPADQRSGSGSALYRRSQSLHVSHLSTRTTRVLSQLSSLMLVIDAYVREKRLYLDPRLESRTYHALSDGVNKLPGSVRRQIYDLFAELRNRTASGSFPVDYRYGKKHFLDPNNRQILKTILFQVSGGIQKKYRTRRRTNTN